jgi:hypothetical protein
MNDNFVNKNTRTEGLYPKSSGITNINENQIVTPFDWYWNDDKTVLYVVMKDGFSFGNVSFSGTVTMDDLPVADPAVSGQLWNDGGTVKVSAG